MLQIHPISQVGRYLEQILNGFKMEHIQQLLLMLLLQVSERPLHLMEQILHGFKNGPRSKIAFDAISARSKLGSHFISNSERSVHQDGPLQTSNIGATASGFLYGPSPSSSLCQFPW